MGMASGDDREEALSTGAPSPAHQRRPTHPPLARGVGCRMDDGWGQRRQRRRRQLPTAPAAATGATVGSSGARCCRLATRPRTRRRGSSKKKKRSRPRASIQWPPVGWRTPPPASGTVERGRRGMGGGIATGGTAREPRRRRCSPLAVGPRACRRHRCSQPWPGKGRIVGAGGGGGLANPPLPPVGSRGWEGGGRPRRRKGSRRRPRPP